MTRCPYCRALVPDLPRHDGECQVLSMALDAQTWPESDRLLPVVNTGHGGARTPLPRDRRGVKFCRCGRGPAIYGHRCRFCNAENARARRKAARL